MEALTVGQRCFVGDHQGTIRWIGRLEGLESDRVGVELDEGSPIRHSGEYNGKKIFPCSPNRGVFVKSHKLVVSVEQAINFRYKHADHQEQVCENLVGVEKIKQKFSALHELSFACLEKSQISIAGKISDVTNLTRMRLSDNFITNFSVVIDVVRQLPLLVDLDLTGNHIQYKTISDNSINFPSRLESLVLCRTGAGQVATVLQEISAFRNLALLNLEDNGISDLPRNFWPPKLHTLDLSKNSLRWSEISNIPRSIFSLNLNSNPLANEISDQSFVNFRALRTVLLHGCEISDWNVVKELSRSLETLENFRLTGNPIYTHPAARQILIASFPSLGILNGAEIRNKFRFDAEIYVANTETVHNLVRGEILEAVRTKHPREQVTAQNRQTRKFQGISVEISGLDRPIQFTTIPSLNVTSFRKLAAKRANWPIDLADTEIRWSPKGDESDLGCVFLLETSEANAVIGDIFGQNAEISVFLSVKDKQ